MKDAKDKIRRGLRAKPFRRFDIELDGGSVRHVDHPEAIAILRDETVVLQEKDGTIDFFDDSSIVEVRFPPTAAGKKR